MSTTCTVSIYIAEFLRQNVYMHYMYYMYKPATGKNLQDRHTILFKDMFKETNVVDIVDRSSLRAPWQNGLQVTTSCIDGDKAKTDKLFGLR